MRSEAVEAMERQWSRHLDVLDALVPMRMQEIALSGATHEDMVARLDAMRCGVCSKNPCQGAASVLGSHVDSWLYEPGSAAGHAAGTALVTSLAVMAMSAEGGVDLGRRHWCAHPHEPGPEGCKRKFPLGPPLPEEEPPKTHVVDVLIRGAFEWAL